MQEILFTQITYQKHTYIYAHVIVSNNWPQLPGTNIHAAKDMGTYVK